MRECVTEAVGHKDLLASKKQSKVFSTLHIPRQWGMKAEFGLKRLCYSQNCLWSKINETEV